MRVAFDQQIFLLQRRGGISRYIVELVNALDTHPEFGIEPELPFRWVCSSTASGLLRQRVHDVDSGVARRLLLAAAAVPLRRYRGADLVHHTFYHQRFLREPGSLPRVITVYDMIPELFPDQVPSGVHLAKEQYVTRADLILAISESTREDLLRHYRGVTAPVVVTPLGVRAGFASPGPNPSPGARYLLHVGARAGYKDFAVLLAALAKLPPPRPRLLAAGGGAFSAVESRLIHQHGLENIVQQRELTDWELAGAYQHALALVMPTRYEGFGLPALEAMVAGTPVVAARSSSLPEVGADVAQYFEPGDDTQLARVLARVLADEALRADMSLRGRSRAAGFTWRETARRTAAAYRLLR